MQRRPHARALGRRRPGRAGCAAAAHHQAGARTPAARRSPPRSPASQACASKTHKQAHSRVQHTAHTGGARATHADARADPTRTRAQHAHASAAPHTEHTSHQQQQACHNPHLTHARTHSPLPAHALGVAVSNQASKAGLCGCLCCLLIYNPRQSETCVGLGGTGYSWSAWRSARISLSCFV